MTDASTGGGTTGLSALEVLNLYRVSIGQAPLDEAGYAEYIKGPPGVIVDPNALPWDAETIYAASSLVTYSGSVWIAIRSTAGDTPETGSDAWNVFIPGVDIALYEQLLAEVEAAKDAALVEIAEQVALATAAKTSAENAQTAAELAKDAAEAAADLAELSATQAQANSRTVATWVDLAALTGATVGEGAEVLDTDAGTHTDPVVGGTVNNAGRYSWSASPAGWERIGDTGLTGKLSKAANLTDLTDYAVAERAIGVTSLQIGAIGADRTFRVLPIATQYAGDVELHSDGTVTGIDIRTDRENEAARELRNGRRAYAVFPIGDQYAVSVDLNAAGEVLALDLSTGGADAVYVVLPIVAISARRVSFDRTGAVVSVETDGADVSQAGYIGKAQAPAMRADGASKAAYYDPDDVLLILPGWGQSKWFGVNPDRGADPLISTAAIYSGKALMPSYGNHVAGRRFTEVSDLIAVPYSTAGETSLPALVNHYIAEVDAATGRQPMVLGAICAESGQSYDAMNKGEAAARDLVNFLTDARDYAFSIGRIPICPALHINHGQNPTDRWTGRGHYLKAMQQFHRWFASVCRNILGQAEDPVFIMTQADAGLVRNVGASNFYTSSTSIAQYELAQMPGFVIAMNEGHLPLSSDGLHCLNEGYYMQGMAHARALFDEINGTGRAGMFVYDAAWRSTTVLDLEVNVPRDGDLELLATSICPDFEAGVETQYGLQFADGAGLIADTGYSLSVIDPASTGPGQAQANKRWLRVTFSTAPAGLLRWSVAMRADTNGLGRTRIASAATYAPLNTLPSGFDDRDFMAASYGAIPTLS